MKQGYNQNNLLGGLSTDRDGMKIQPDTLLDAINATVSPRDGNKLTYQAVKSMVPQSSIYQHLYDLQSHVVCMEKQDILSGNLQTVALNNVKMKEAYFVFYADGFDTETLQGKSDFYLTMSVKYLGDSTYTNLNNINLSFLKKYDVIPVTVDENKYITSVKYQVFGPAIHGYLVGTLDYFGEAPQDARNNVGPSANKIILGTKTFNNVTYFIVGCPEYKTTPKLFKNNIGITPTDDWNNTAIADNKFRPDFIEGDSERDQLQYSSKVAETKPIQLSYQYIGFNGHAGSLFSDNLVTSKLFRVPVGDAVKMAGDYTFNITATLKATIQNKSWQYLQLGARLCVERKDGSVYAQTVGYPDLHDAFGDSLGWVISDKQYNCSNLTRNANTTLKSLVPGDRVFLEMMGEARSKGDIGLTFEGGVNSSTTFLISEDKDSTLPAEIYKGLETLLSNVKTINATSNLHFNGRVELSVNQNNLIKADGAAPPKDIVAMHTKDAKISVNTVSLGWEAPDDSSITEYEIHYIISTNKDLSVSSNQYWKVLGRTSNKWGYDISIDSLTKGLSSDVYYVWFRIAPRNAYTIGNWSGGFWRFTINKVAMFGNKSSFIFVGSNIDPVNDFHKVDTRALNPVTEAWESGTLPADLDCYEYAIDYSDFKKVDPQGNGVIHGISPGMHSLYIKKTTSGKSVYAKRTIEIKCDNTFEDLELTTSIDMSGEKNISDFSVLLKVHDPGNPYGTYKIFLSPYEELSVESLKTLTPVQTVQADTEVTIPVVQKMAKTGNLHIYAVPANNRDILYNCGLEYMSERQIGNPTVYYKRVVKGVILISDELKNDRYNLEIGTFPSPYYGHLKGNLKTIYQPLQNLNSSAFITNEIKLSGNTYVDMTIQPVYDGSVNILFTDGEKVPRIVNSGFAVLADGNYELINRIGGKQTNKYTPESVEVSTRLVQTENSIPKVELQAVTNSGGHLQVGSYKLLFKLATVDGNETDIIAETGLIPIFHGETLGSIQGGPTGNFTSKSIKVVLKNVDSYFNHVALYVDHTTGVDELVRSFYKVDFKYLIKDVKSSDSVTDVNITFTGFEPVIAMSQDMLSDQKMPISSVSTLAQVQNRLFVANFNHEDIDYTKLFKVGMSILVTPSMGPGKVQLTDLMESWPTETEAGDLQSFSQNFLNEKLKSFDSVDMNTGDKSSLREMVEISRSQGYHNPMFVEKYAAYWPKETYVFNISFISKDNHITRPIPIVGADFIDMHYVPGVLDNDAAVKAAFEQAKNSFEKSTSSPWIAENGISFNNIGVCRFPKQDKPNQVYFPKFTFNINDFNKHYPGFLEKFKGFFFTRTERKPDILMQGFIGPVHSTLTDKTVIRDQNPTEYVPKYEETPAALKACVPALYSGMGILAYDHSESESGDEINWVIKKEEHAGSFVTNMSTGKNFETTYEDDYHYNTYANKKAVFKNWFKSGDIFANFVQAATDFNGKSYGIQLVAGIDPNTVNQYSSDIQVIPFLEDVDSTSTLGHTQHILQALKPSKVLSIATDRIFKITPDFRPYGSNSRSPGGFSSLIPFRSLGRIFKNNADQDILTYLTGAFTAYVGLSSSEEIPHGFYDIYPGTSGPLSSDALKNVYSNNNNDQHIAITPRYLFSEYVGKRSIEILAARGDCFVTTTIHNIARSLSAISGNPSSSSSKFTASAEGSNEPNSYRGAASSMSIMATHASNHLNYARHTEVVDERESAAFGGPRSFLPLSGMIDNMLCISHGAKQQDTEAFNRGYADNFMGKKYYSISGTSPYYTKKGASTIAFSGVMDRNSFYNAFRDFDLEASKTYGSELGSITRLLEFRNNLIAVHSTGVSLVQINEQQLLNGNSESPLYAGSTDVLPEKPVQLSSQLGTRYPRSVEKSERFVYGVDADQGKIWRTDGNGLEIVSDNIVESILRGFLYEMTGLDEIPGERYIASFYDPSKREMIFSIYNKNSQHPNFALPMQPDIYFFLKNLYNLGLAVSANNAAKASELLYHWANETWYGSVEHLANRLNREDRLFYVENFLQIHTIVVPEMLSRINNCLTLIYSEDLGIWVTRWSVAPEFMFHHNGITYSVANKQDTSSLPDTVLNFIPDIEAQIVAGGMSANGLRVFSKIYHAEDTLRRIIWRHEGFHPAIPMYGSMYGKDPLFEIAFCVAQEPTVEKTFETLSIVGSHSTPSVVMYTMSDDNPLLNKVLSTPDYEKYTDWEACEADYFSKFGSSTRKGVIYPAMFFKQYVHDRRHNPVFRSNALYSMGRFELIITKGLQPMFISKQDWERMKFRYLQDKSLKIQIRYESGEEVKINALLTTFSY